MKFIKFKTKKNQVIFEKNGKLYTKSLDFCADFTLMDSSISCGVHQLIGINFLADDVNSFAKKNSFTNKMTEKLFERALINKVKSVAEEGEFFGAFILISTNITNNDNIKLIEEVLGKLCSFKSRALVNPNSDNKIRIWGLPFSLFRCKYDN